MNIYSSKICTKCLTSKPLDCFVDNKQHKDGKSSHCRECNSLYRKTPEYKVLNRSYMRDYLKKPDNKIKRKQCNKKYLENNPNAKLAKILRTRINKVLKGITKSVSAVKDLGCSMDDLWLHLESQFKPGMTKDNHGHWHIDHIKPLSSFDLSNPDEQKKAVHYTNLQPLWALENLVKGDSIKPMS